MCKYYLNPILNSQSDILAETSSDFGNIDILNFHQSLKKYQPTPLIKLPGLAEKLGVKNILVKDESQRFDINAFKIIGASYAVYRCLKQKYQQSTGVEMTIEDFNKGRAFEILGEMTFCTATDGNHGRAIARMAALTGNQCVIFIPKESVPARVKNIENEGAKEVLVDGSYDDAVRMCASEAEKNGWLVLSDTSYPGYEEIPRWIMSGYTTLFKEIDSQLEDEPMTANDLFFVQCGVGSLAATAGWYYKYNHSDNSPFMVCIEPTEADCMMETVKNGAGELVQSKGSLTTIMAGLNCGTASLNAYPIVAASYDLFLAIPDCYSKMAMRTLYNPVSNDTQIISGESGAAGMGGLLALLENEKLDELKSRIPLDPKSRILILNTEGDTDPEGYMRIIENS